MSDNENSETERPKRRRRYTANSPGPMPSTRENYHGEGPVSEDKVVELFGAKKTPTKNKGGIVPEGGRRSHDDDPRVRDRVRLGKRWSEIMRRVNGGEFTWEEFVSTLSPEELARGQLKDSRGNFGGRPPSIVPRAFHDACVRELLERGRTLYKENYVAAIQAMTDIATSKFAKESDRIKAAQFVIERLEGKVPERVEISAADPWEQIIGGIVATAEEKSIANAQDYLSRRNAQVTGDTE